MRLYVLAGLVAVSFLACKDEGSGGDDCPNLVDDCIRLCGEGNVQDCSCVDGEPHILCKDGSSSSGGGGGDDGGDDGDDGGGSSSGDDDGGSSSGTGGSGGDDGGGDDGGGDDGGGDDGGGSSSGTGSAPEGCEDLSPPPAGDWDVTIDFVPTSGFASLQVIWTSGSWSMHYAHEFHDGAPLVHDTDPPYVVTWQDPPLQGADPVESLATYDDGALSFTFIATAGTTTVHEITNQGDPSSGDMADMVYSEWEWGPNSTYALVDGGCVVSLPDLSWDGTAE